MNEALGSGSDLTRRELFKRAVVVTSLTTGFALAVEPVGARTVHTDSVGLIDGAALVPTQDGNIPGYFARPDREGVFPIILVVHEIFGVHEHIKDVCRRFAKRGYTAVAPELFARVGDVSKLSDIQQILPIVSKAPDAQVLSDLDSCVLWAEQNAKGDRSRLGVTGFCWGGRITWLYATHSSDLKAGVAWYGRIVGQTDSLHPKNPIDAAGDLKAPVLGLYGGQDQGIPVATVDAMKVAASVAGKTVEIVVYPDSGHAFHADYRPSYNPKDSMDGERRMYAWFEAYGVK